MAGDAHPLVVGIGGSARTDSVTNRLLAAVLAQTALRGARTQAFTGDLLARLPIFAADDSPSVPEAAAMSRAVAAADGIVIATPGYHGGMSGLVKNGLDHLETLRTDRRPYLDGRPVGVVVTAAGWQATGTTVVAVRSTVHALRGWPTPFAATVNTAEPVYDEDGVLSAQVAGAVAIVAGQIMDFVGWRAPR